MLIVDNTIRMNSYRANIVNDSLRKHLGIPSTKHDGVVTYKLVFYRSHISHWFRLFPSQITAEINLEPVLHVNIFITSYYCLVFFAMGKFIQSLSQQFCFISLPPITVLSLDIF